MNPLCCIAPVSVEKDRAGFRSQTLSQELVSDDIVVYDSSNNAGVNQVRYSSRRSLSIGNDVLAAVGGGGGGDLAKDRCDENVETKSCVGVLYKWVNYGKGWRARWFVLEDGVLSYYKVHGPDKIGVGNGRENGVKV